MNDNSEQRGKSHAAHTTCGIWPFASRINHSCVTNCRRSFIGDMQIVRASQDIEADTELYFGYNVPLPHQTYEETQKNLQSWGFVCCCALCLVKKSTPGKVVQQRLNLNDSLKALLKPGASVSQLTRARKILEDLGKTYESSEDAVLVPRMELWDPYFALGTELLERNKPADGLEMLLRGLDALGFSIVACPPRDAIDENGRKKATLEIKRWGQANDYTVPMFLRMMDAYEKLAPELCSVAKDYAGIAYSICFGEKETIGTLDPRLV